LQERAPQGLDAADIGLRRAGADRKPYRRTRHVGRTVAPDRARCDQLVELRPRQNGDIKSRAVLDRAFERGAEPEFDFKGDIMCALEVRHEFAQERAHGAATEDFEGAQC
jgi:hypothetical protein